MTVNWVHVYIPHLLWYFNMNPDKVICSCYKVTKGDILRSVEKGAASFKEVKKDTKVGKACGKCKKKAKKLTKKMIKKQEEKNTDK